MSYSLQEAFKSKDTAPPYHVFQCLDDYFVFDTSGCRFYQINELSYHFLKLLQNFPTNEVESMLISDGYPEALVTETSKGILLIGDQGLFDVPDFTITDVQLEDWLANMEGIRHWSIDLMLTEKCNLACKYCFCATSRDVPSGIMDEATIKKAIDMLFGTAKKNADVDINFFGGEPLLNKKGFRYAIEYSRKLADETGRKISYRMTTNGTILDDEILELLLKHKIPVMISLDGPENIHDLQCPTHYGGGSYHTVAGNIRRLLELQHPVEVRCTLAHPMPRLKELVEFFDGFSSFGFRRIVIAPVQNPFYNPTPLDFQVEDYDALAQESRELLPWIIEKLRQCDSPFRYFNFIHEVQGIFNGTFSQTVGAIRCSACPVVINVATDGSLYPCCRFSGMKKWKTGDVESGPDYESYKSFWRKYRKQVNKSCSNCWAFPICKGPCPWEIHTPDGNFTAPKNCDFLRSHVEDAAYVYAHMPQDATKTPINI